MNNYLYIISLRYCPYCINTRRLLQENNIKHQDNIIKDEDKFKYKTEEISTFPQIYYVKRNLKKKILIGGNSDLENIIELNNNIKSDKDKMDELISDFLKSNTKINKKILLKVLFLINKKNLTGGYNSNLFNSYSESQLTSNLIQSFLGKVLIFIRGKQKKSFFSSYNNKLEVYEILEYKISRDNNISLLTNCVEWECHDIYCTMRRKSEFILTPEIIKNKFNDMKYVQFLVTKDNYKFVDKKKQNLTKLKTGDIIPLLSKYGDYQGEYLVSEEDIDNDIKNKQFFYITSITQSNLIVDEESKEKNDGDDLEEQQDDDLDEQQDDDLEEQQDDDLEEQQDDDLSKKIEEDDNLKIDLDNSTYQINSFGFEIGYRIDTYPINENKSYDLGTKNVKFFQNLIESTTDGNWIILQKSN